MGTRIASALALFALCVGVSAAPAPDDPAFAFRPGDKVCLWGPAVVERMQHDGWLESLLQLRLPESSLSFRNLGFASDRLTVAQRTAGFGTLDEWLDRCDASVLLASVGTMESFQGPGGLPAFRRDLSAFVDHVTATSYDGVAPPRLVLLTPTPVEDIDDSNLPDATAANARLAPYAEAVLALARERGLPCVDLFSILAPVLAAPAALTHDGTHFTAAGNRLLAHHLEQSLLGLDNTEMASRPWARLPAVRALVQQKNEHWFDRYRVTDGYNVYGGRSSLVYDGVTNFDVLQRELQVLDALCHNLDLAIAAEAGGKDPPAAAFMDVPALIPVATNRPGPLPGGAYAVLSGEDALDAMTVDTGLAVSLFADEGRFPELANPVQMGFDPAGNLWVACWPSYPHAVPGEAKADKLIVLHDDDGDGSADRSVIFADDLHNPTGFTFWDGGVFVAACPDILFLADTDGDGRADLRERVLHGLSSADTHHSANSFVMGPDGALYFQEGIFHQSQVESVWGPVDNRDGCVWRYEPRTRRVERHVAFGFLNPHGHVFDRFGTEFVTDGTGNVNFLALPISGRVLHPAKHKSVSPFFQQRSRPAAATAIVSSASLPDDMQGDYLIANVIGFQGILRYDLSRSGSGVAAEEEEPLLFSSDPNFRPVDLEVGPDGALWLIDWHNPLIGHMQHHLRDPSRDKRHGRVYRVSALGRPKSASPPVLDQPVPELVALLAHPEDGVRQRVRAELSARPAEQVVDAARAWVAGFDGESADHELHRLEALWVQQQQAVLDRELLLSLLESPEPLLRAAATTVVRRFRRELPDALDLLAVRVADDDPAVRLAALVALSEFDDARAAELALSSLSLPNDRYLNEARAETLTALEPVWRAALASGSSFSEHDPVGLAHALTALNVDELLGARPGRGRSLELLSRHELDGEQLRAAAADLATADGGSSAQQLLAAIARADARSQGHVDHLLANLFAALHGLPEAERASVADDLVRLGQRGLRPSTRRLATVARMHAEGSARPTWDASLSSPGRLIALVDAAPLVRDPALAAELFELMSPLLDAPPAELAEQLAAAVGVHGRFVRIELPGPQRTLTLAEVQVSSRGANLAPRGSATQSSTNWGGVASRALDGNTSGVYGDNGQTHTMEDQADPWWQLDLNAEYDLDAVVLWNRSESGGVWNSRLDGYLLSVLDAEGRVVFQQRAEGAAPAMARHELSPPALQLRRAAVTSLPALGVRSADAVALLTARFGDPDIRESVVSALLAVPADDWPESHATEFARTLSAHLSAADPDDLLDGPGRALLALGDRLPPYLPPEEARALRSQLRRLGPQVIVIRPVPDSLLFDVVSFDVVAGRPVELRVENGDVMPHNLVLTAPGALAEVGLAGEAMAASPDAWERGFVPDLPQVLLSTGLLQPGQSQTLVFDAPDAPGDHPYVCTFPGHWARMNGVMHVLASWEELEARALERSFEPAASEAPVAELTSERAARRFVRAWTTRDFRADLERVESASPQRGRQLADGLGCVLCHQVGGLGGATGPALEEAVAQLDLPGLLAAVLDPSEFIADGYASELVFTSDGRVLSGRLLREDDNGLLLADNPYRNDAVLVPHDEIDERRQSGVSAMPEGLLWTCDREEILDLLAWLRSLAEYAPER